MWQSGPDRLARARLVAGAFALAAAAAVTGCGERLAHPTAADTAAVVAAAAPASDETLALGRKVYNYRCYFCHGYSGDARTLASSYLEPRPRDFTATPLDALPREAMITAVREGRGGTAMKGFNGILTANEIQAVTDFVRHEFMEQHAVNTRYHTAGNGWPDHERNRAAFPFARGDIAIDTAWDQLDAQQQEGKRLFLSACISCHDRGRVNDAGALWESRPLSYPRDAYCTSCHQDAPASAPQGTGHPQRAATHTFSDPDGSVPVRSPQGDSARVADAYLIHDRRPLLRNPTALESRGEDLFQRNCAFCHAADGTSKGWIGSFLEPHPRDLTSPREMRGMTRERIAHSIAEGLPGTSMPAWKSVLEADEIDAVIAYISRAFHPLDGARGS